MALSVNQFFSDIQWGLHPGTIQVTFNEGMFPDLLLRAPLHIKDGLLVVKPQGELGNVKTIYIPMNQIAQIVEYGE